MKEVYSINDVAMMTGLTTRTLRNYIKAGFLDGEKVDGVWTFTPEDFSNFIENPNVKPSIHAKYNSIVYDFMLDNHKKENEICMILDFTQEEAEEKEISTFFCKEINMLEEKTNVRFSYYQDGDLQRVIIKGVAECVLKIVNQYYNN